MNKHSIAITRRQALKTAGSFMILPAGLARGYTANEKLNIGIIGIAGIGRVNARTFNSLGENIAAVCDVDTRVLDERAAPYPKARRYTDFRKMIEKEKLDAVVVAVPDHSHAYISIWAMKHGLHVYCQKPLCQSVQEARIMARVAAETKVVTQMGTQTSAEPSTLRSVERIQSGSIGEITDVYMATDRPIWPQGYDRPAGSDPIPSEFNWDLWLGTAPVRPFVNKWPQGHPVYDPANKNQFRSGPTVYHPLTWRGWVDFGSGAMGDIAPHIMNVVFMALDLGAPAAVEVLETSGMHKEMYPSRSTIRFDFSRGEHPPFSIHWYDGNQLLPESIMPKSRVEPPPPPGAKPARHGIGNFAWIGTKGSYPAGLGPYIGQSTEEPPAPPQREWDREEVHVDFARAIKNGKQAPCHFGYAGPFTEAYQLGNVALRVGHRIEWDPLAFRITNCREANQYLYRNYRKGWDLKEICGSAWYEPPSRV
ncbi:MAG: Gfo/Idh/MocA family oxidoreductase [Bryobacterales bacterium]|nr:Gfo/Idh/MocA family oxidoreductase [Bryobacterales bacterium]